MNRYLKIAFLALAGWSVPALAAAQEAKGVVTPLQEQERRAVERQAVVGGRGRLVATVESRITTGRPYSADAVTESLQVLGDGNRISKKSTTRVFRDADGRTRREPLGPDGLPQSISINDPVGHTSFTLDPATKTAAQSNILALRRATAVGGGGTASGRLRGGTGAGAASSGAGRGTEARKVQIERTRTAQVEIAETSRDASVQRKLVVERAAAGGGKTTKEDLGEQVIEGVRATGTRTTTVIPAGAIGNLQEIRIVSEQWFSPDLEVLVLTKHSDPRVGETTYRLENIVRGQPDPNLFVVPPDYTVKQRLLRQRQ